MAAIEEGGRVSFTHRGVTTEGEVLVRRGMQLRIQSDQGGTLWATVQSVRPLTADPAVTDRTPAAAPQLHPLEVTQPAPRFRPGETPLRNRPRVVQAPPRDLRDELPPPPSQVLQLARDMSRQSRAALARFEAAAANVSAADVALAEELLERGAAIAPDDRQEQIPHRYPWARVAGASIS